LTGCEKFDYNGFTPLGAVEEEAQMFKALAVSLKASDFTKFKCSQGSCDGDWIVESQVANRLDGYDLKFAEIYGDMMDGLAVPDDFISTELDGTYDKFGNIVVHWRNDGFIDFVAFEHERDAELEFSKIIALQTAE
jgi:hypothetical protein